MTLAELVRLIRADRTANARYPKSRLVLTLFRTAHYLHLKRGPLARAAYVLVAGLYKLVAEWVLGIEIPPTTRIGAGLRLRHGVGTVVNPSATIGANVLLRHGVTIGNRREAFDCPTIEDGVELGVGAVVIGAITVGAGARVGPNTVVSRDVPAGSTVLPQPMEIRSPRRATASTAAAC